MAAADFTGFLGSLFPQASAGLRQLYAGAADNAGLLRTDFYTIRDLMELSGYTDDEPLQVLLLCLVLALDEGSLCIDVSADGLTGRLRDLTRAEAEARSWAERAAQALQQSDYAALIGHGAGDCRPVVRQRRGARDYLYFQKYLQHELELEAELTRRLRSARPETAAEHLRTALDDVLSKRPARLGGRPLRLNRDQLRAVAVALVRNFAVISGGPGTGKTSIIFTLLRCLSRLGFAAERIALAAPTGRAAQRLTEAVRRGLGQLEEPLAEADSPLKELSAATLHQLLAYQPQRGTFRHHRENPLAADVIIVDEVSMVGLVLMARLFQATAPECKLILLGDKNQLPSVDAGAVLAHLAPGADAGSGSPALQAQLAALLPAMELTSLATPDRASPQSQQPLADVLVVLEQNYRSQANIIEVAQAINRQDTSIVDRLGELALPLAPEAKQAAGCWLLAQERLGKTGWRRFLEQWAEDQFLAPTPAEARLVANPETSPEASVEASRRVNPGGTPGGEKPRRASAPESFHSLLESCVLPELITDQEKPLLDQLFTALGRSRVLTLVREGPWGCAGINAFLEQQLRPRLDRRGAGHLFCGAPVLITRNDHGRQLFNGDVGITLRTSRGGYRVVFQRLDGYSALPLEGLPSHELAFALTVHKSQGSEYDRVLLVLPPEGGRRLLTKEMIYTGITRARERVVIAASREALRTAIGRRVERDSALLRELR